MNHMFAADAMKRSNRRNMRWYQENLMQTLYAAKANRARDIDVTIGIGEQLIKKLGEKVDKPVVVPLREVVPSEDDSMMKPIEPEVLDILYGSSEKGGDQRYLRERNKKSPEDKFFFRAVTSWDYGWQQKQSRLLVQDAHHGRCAVVRESFYRRSNCGPDPPHYGQPSGAAVGICGEYACNAN